MHKIKIGMAGLHVLQCEWLYKSILLQFLLHGKHGKDVGINFIAVVIV